MRRHAHPLCERVEPPDLGQLDGEVGKEDVFRALPLLGPCGDLVLLDLVFAEVGCVR